MNDVTVVSLACSLCGTNASQFRSLVRQEDRRPFLGTAILEGDLHASRLAFDLKSRNAPRNPRHCIDAMCTSNPRGTRSDMSGARNATKNIATSTTTTIGSDRTCSPAVPATLRVGVRIVRQLAADKT